MLVVLKYIYLFIMCGFEEFCGVLYVGLYDVGSVVGVWSFLVFLCEILVIVREDLCYFVGLMMFLVLRV